MYCVQVRAHGIDVCAVHPSPVASRFYDGAHKIDEIAFFKGHFLLEVVMSFFVVGLPAKPRERVERAAFIIANPYSDLPSVLGVVEC